MSWIFISYRRDDSAGHAGRLFDRLSDHFGRDQVFMDIDSIEPGVDFAQVVEDTMGRCEAVVALIGPHWLTVPAGADWTTRRISSAWNWRRRSSAGSGSSPHSSTARLFHVRRSCRRNWLLSSAGMLSRSVTSDFTMIRSA
jgi:TIR domain